MSTGNNLDDYNKSKRQIVKNYIAQLAENNVMQLLVLTGMRHGSWKMIGSCISVTQ